ncbi:hypothetical protein LTR10_001895 [Elasticomyces elasticus]|nr:hypothetical protein LTR10_001895 [Elasticomyces elasticus]KAK4975394.1 hypothetical protein LTR42_004604 [Elasticomyces elasticus]
MAETYSNAEEVLVWLGPSYSSSDPAMEILGTPLHLHSPQFEEMWTPENSLAIRRLFSRPYWERLWVFQELKLAKRKILMCGEKSVAWTSLEDFLHAINDKQIINGDSELSPSDLTSETRESWTVERRAAAESCRAARFCPATPTVQHASQTDRRGTLWETMFSLSHLRCTEPRDRVYALLGVSRCGLSIQPDYTVQVVTLLHKVLESQHRLHSPQTIHEVESQCSQLEGLFGLPRHAMLAISGYSHRLVSASETDATLAYGIGPALSGINFWWAVFHGHGAVEAMLTRLNAESNPSNHLERWFEFGVMQNQMALLDMLLALEVVRTDHSLITKLRSLDYGCQASFFGLALLRGHAKVARKLLDTSHFDVSRKLPPITDDIPAMCPLHFAINQRDLEMVKELLTIPGIDTEHRCDGSTALESATSLAKGASKPCEDVISNLRASLAKSAAHPSYDIITTLEVSFTKSASNAATQV